MWIQSNLKPPLTIDQQINLLKSKGLIIDNLEEAQLFLQDNNYYRLNIYFHKLMDNQDHFQPGITFSRIISICENDSQLRKHIFSILEPIEIKVKTNVAYYLGCHYGSIAFYRKEIYKSPQLHDRLMNSFIKDISYKEKDPVVQHHYQHYSGYFPIWTVVEFLTFNNISLLFNNLQTQDQKRIAIDNFGINEALLTTWIHALVVMRNICAHHGYLYQREYSVPISFGRDSAKYPYLGNTLFGVFYCLEKVSDQKTWSMFYDNLIPVIGEKTLITDYCFPNDFQWLSK